MSKSRLRPQSPVLFQPQPPARASSPRPSSVFEDGDAESIMSTTSRPSSLALMPPSSSGGPRSPPSLREILTDTAPSPYSLSAFTAFLSHNHCLETLEFTMDAERYRTAHAEFLAEQSTGRADGSEYVCALWHKILQAYIQQYGLREVNLPSHVRDRLLSLPATPVPPNPSELDEAVRIVYELMNDSVLGPFVASVAPAEEIVPEHSEHRHGRSRLRIPKESSWSGDESTRSPKSGFLPMLNIAWATNEPKSSASSSSDPHEHGGLTDDSASAPSPPAANEPMTPPTTPPTADWGFSTSPNSLQRAISAHNSGWKKMGAKLGLNRKGRKREVMPIPEDPETSSSEDTTMGMIIDSLDEKPKATHVINSVTRRSFTSDWEEPHPGQRFPVPSPENATPGAGIQKSNCLEVPKVGMAAKGYRSRRFLRPRLRTSSLKQLKIPQTPQEACVRTVACCTPQSNTSSTRPLIASSGSQTISPTTTIERRPSNVIPAGVSPMYGCETQKGVHKPNDDSYESTASSSKHSSMRFSTLTDFSGHLKLPMSPVNAADDSDNSSLMSLEHDTPMTTSISNSSSLSPDEDPYGWEAELNRKVSSGRLDCCPNFQYRRAGGGKKSLLQKVLSLGPREFGRSHATAMH
ncbi:hypothetical protein QBC38DRAFT_520962 [Podospora fimiseda]|uniref:RGS domain-containing protein n=1 Tax=Podospora fimiseda TaxID=252190 RepID=A0AAN7BDK8_9PEZI|nr:hypothetical protein QBC38DRAFT_520962 [Podospora fimiseda]